MAILFIVCSTACSLFAGAYSDDPHGSVVDCDSKLPMNELLHCIDDKYAVMDKIYMSPIIRERRKALLRYKKTEEPALSSEEVSSFPKLKNNILYDRNKTGNGAFHIKDDKYNNLTLGIYQTTHTFNRIGYKLQFPFKEGIAGNYIDNTNIGYDGYVTRKYARSYWAASKDILITTSKGKKKLYAGSYEVIPLKDNKALYIINVSTYCQRDFSKKEIEFAKEKGVFPDENMCPIYTLPLESIDKSFDICGSGYLYFTDTTDRIPEYVEDYPIPKNEQSNQPFDHNQATSYGKYINYETYSNKIINLSADKRNNPTKLYINLKNRTFEISLSKLGVNTDK